MTRFTTRPELLTGPTARTTTALTCTLAAAGFLALGCAPGEGDGEGASDTAAATGADTAGGVDTAARPGRTVRDTLVTDTGRAGDAPDTLVFQREREAATETTDTVAADTAPTRSWPAGGYMVYLREGVVPDSVAADHGVEPESLEPTLPGFYARLTAEQATALGRDERVKEMAKQIEERPLPEPRKIPTGADGTDTASGG